MRELMEVNRDAFISAMKKKGIVLSELSEELGYGGAYISARLRKNPPMLYSTVIKSIEYITGIKYEVYSPTKEQTVKEDRGGDGTADEKAIEKILIRLERVIFNLTSMTDSVGKMCAKMNDIYDIEEAILKKHIGLDDVVYRGTKKALEE